MASARLGEYASQVRAVTKKNLVLLVTRHWISTLIQVVLIPVAFHALILNINNYGGNERGFGIGTPRPIRSIQESIPATQQLVLVKSPGIGSDVDAVIKKLSDPLPKEQLVVLDDILEARARCQPNTRGVSGCYAVVDFLDSPLTPSANRTWNYTLQFDQARDRGAFNVHKDDNDIQRYQLPVQLAVDNAITNSSVVPSEYMSTVMTQEQVDALDRASFNNALVTTYCIVFWIGTIFGIYHAVGFVTRERAEGVSQLIDAMGGGPAVRVAASILSLSAVQLVGWIVAGALYSQIIFFDSNAAIFIFWQLFAGLSLVCASVFAAAFFRTRRISGIFAVICFACLAGGAAILLNRKVDTGRVIFLSLLFPSMNYVFQLSQFGRYAMNNQPINMASRPENTGLSSGYIQETFFVPIYAFWLMLIFQIIVYPVLAVFAERWMHGINFKGRILADDATSASSTPDAAVRTEGLTKTYPSQWYKKLFRINDGSGLKALDSLDLVAQPNQIVCLLGVNGAGKSTTLDLLSGFHTPTSGSMYINARPSHLGVCPQKNILFDRLTVLEHLIFWRDLKRGPEDLLALHALIAACDLTPKTNAQSRTLSGGQKRKLQLACMFVGGTKICMMDEVTTGLDPISRRTIWNIILAERSKRCMIFTTHFLDEGEVLADQIVILSKGVIKCQGSGAELKNKYGGGYRVYLPRSAEQSVDLTGLEVEGAPVRHQDQAVYRVRDSTVAAKLVERLEAKGVQKVHVAGPTVEDVFLGVARQDVDSASDSEEGDAAGEKKKPGVVGVTGELTKGQATPFWTQVKILLGKRFRILPRYWVGAFLVLALPIAGMPPINGFLSMDFVRADCGSVREFEFSSVEAIELRDGQRWGFYGDKRPYGPPAANETLYSVLRDFPIGGPEGINSTMVANAWELMETYEQFEQYIRDAGYIQGGIWLGDDKAGPTLAHAVEWNAAGPLRLLRVLTSMISGVEINSGMVNVYRYFNGGANFRMDAWMYMLYACFILTVYPAFFALYPAFERLSNVRTLQCSNGVRPLPIWMAYFLFDFIFVVLISVAYTVTITMQFPYWVGSTYMLPVTLLHGMCGILISYIVSIRASSQLSSFLWSLFFGIIPYFGMALAYTLPTFLSDSLNIQRNTDIISYVLGIFFPIANVFRGIAFGFNYASIACRDSSEATSGSWWGYGFPITYLVCQVVLLAALLVWLDRDLTFAMFRPRRRPDSSPESDVASASDAAAGVEKEAARVKVSSDTDLLRMVHISKSFKGTKAVDDVSLGLAQNEILALLGPNGAGKTTIVNMVRGELRPDSGNIYLEDTDVTGGARKLAQSIGVCPQFDALDLLTARQHLEFYARIHGVKGKAAVRSNAEIAMARVGLTEHADKQAAKLSGGNRRKLSLAIALMGDPAVLILDEPSSAMDAAAKRKMWKVLAEEIAPGRSVLLTTHSMEEADALATRAAILSGKLLAVGTTQTLRERYSNLYHVDLVLKSAPHSSKEETASVEDWVRQSFPDASFEGVNVGGQIKFVVPVESAVAEQAGKKGTGVGRVIEVLEKHKEELGLQDYSIGAPTLERVFLSVVRDNYREDDEKRRPAWRRFLGLE
ncbi:putative ABC transporter [Podospora aff. communis PSN243]|uniref:ABC transporter n=1 Tax=Podospora aff. communis PSN243 TaxID=3040156 RepID=A0AAV9GP35_9PEZI|nr:putative ABC transporter [Podospora aff. communis PSN243]